MNRKLQLWGISMLVFALQATGARGQGYEFAAVSNSVTSGINFSSVANNGNVFVCVGAANSPVMAVNTNNFAAFAASNSGGGYLLESSAWTNTLNSPIKLNSLSCVAAQPNGFIASGASNAVYVSSDGVNWAKRGYVLPAGNQAYSVDGIAYNPASGTFAAALAVYEASWTTNPPSTNVWQGAAVQSQSFAESFRAVTPFASSDMAMCGILGDIRISTDGGKDWSLNQQVNSSLPNLLGIASDGGSNLVCAGDYSMLEVSTNGGPNATWTLQTNFDMGTSGSATNFNAVAYNPTLNVFSTVNAFLAAGSIGGNGLIVMAPQNTNSANWTWTRQTNLWTLENGVLVPLANIPNPLNGAVFANSGFFQGIAMLVGNNGTVMVGGLPPPAPVNFSGIAVTNVVTEPQSNNPLVASIVYDAYHPSEVPTVETIDWYSAATGGILLATNSPSFQPPASLYNTCGTYTNWAAERDLRTGLSSTNRTPFVFYIVPGAPTDPVSVTNCDINDINDQYGMCAMTPASVTVATNADNPPGTIRVNWYDVNANLLASDTFGSNSDIVTFTPTNLPAGLQTIYAQATNPATGLASANWTSVTVKLNALPQLVDFSPEIYTNILTNPETDHLVGTGEITAPGFWIFADVYTNGNPSVATYENPDPPFAPGGESPPFIVDPAPAIFTPTNVLCGVNNYYVRARLDDPNFTACACQSTNLIQITYVLLPPAPIDAIAGLTNVLTGAVQTNAPIWVDVVTNAVNPTSSFTVNWYSTPQGSNSAIFLNNSSDTNFNNRFFYTPTNAVCGIYTNWAETVAVNGGVVSTNRTPVVFAIIPPAPTDPVSVTNCDINDINGQYGMCVMTPASVTVVTNALYPPGVIRVNWYDVNSNLVANDTFSSNSDIVTFTPTNLPPGVYTYYAQATDPATGLVSANWTSVTVQLNALPQWTDSSSEVYTNTLTNPEINPVIALPSITNLSAITGIEPSATVVIDWYTNSDPTVSTYENPDKPFVATGSFPTNQLCGTYTYYARARVMDTNFTACACQSSNLIQVTYALLPPAPIDAVIGLTNVLTGAVQTNAPIWVDVLTNADNPATNFTVNWYSTPQGSNSAIFLNNSSDTNLNNRFFYTPTNAVCGIYTNWAETVAVNGGVVSTNRTPVVFAIIPAAPTAVGTTDVTNCLEVPNPTFTVAVTNGQTANWYTSSSGGTLLTNALSYTPTNSSVGAWTFSAFAVDPNSGLSSTGAVTATLTLYSCSGSPVISVNAASGTGTIQWPGNLTLLSTTNLTPPVVWTSVATGSNFLAPNTVTFTNTIPPMQFFRLTN